MDLTKLSTHTLNLMMKELALRSVLHVDERDLRFAADRYFRGTARRTPADVAASGDYVIPPRQDAERPRTYRKHLAG